MFKHVFLTGAPGVGKTTLIQKTLDVMTTSGVSLEGFYTQEVREGGHRVGFDIVTLSGERGHLSRIRAKTPCEQRRVILTGGHLEARVGHFDPRAARGLTGKLIGKTGAGPGVRELTVGQYIVDLPSFEKLALPLFKSVDATGARKLLVIDEIGKMELFSQAFLKGVRQILDRPSCCVLGTIPLTKGKPLLLVEEIRTRADVRVFTVTKDNRDVLLQDIVSEIQECLKHSG